MCKRNKNINWSIGLPLKFVDVNAELINEQYIFQP